jgi:hypothetical protein
MKWIVVAALILTGIGTASAQYGYGTTQPYGSGSNQNSHYVSPYTRGDGTYVDGHYQTNPNNTQLDNYGTRGNYNPYTGQIGTRSPRY